MSQFHQAERPRFFTGQTLTADDLQQEQDYFRGKALLHNRFLHGWGIVAGLSVTLDQGTSVVVSPGFALDCAGHELLLPETERIPLAGVTGRHHVTIRYMEEPFSRKPSFEGESEFSRLREVVRLELALANPSAGHRGRGPGTPGCGHSHALCLATVSQHGARWRVAPAKRGILLRK